MDKLILALLVEKFGGTRKQIAHYNHLLKYLPEELLEMAVDEGTEQFKRKASYKVTDRTDVLLEGPNWEYSVQWDAPAEILRPVWIPDPKGVAARIARFLDGSLDEDLVEYSPAAIREITKDLERIVSKPDVLKDMLKGCIKVAHATTFQATRFPLALVIAEAGYRDVEADFNEDEYNELPSDYILDMSLFFEKLTVGTSASKIALLERCRAEGEVSWL